jgi:hypothetical protein
MKAIGINKGNKHSLTLSFDKGEKCFCCSKVFLKKTDVVQSFKTKKEYEEYISNLNYHWNIEVTNELITNKNK